MLLLGSSTQFEHTNWGLGSVGRLLTQHQAVLGQQQHIWEFSFNQTLFSQSCSWTCKLRMVPTRWPSSPWFSRWWQAQPVTAGSVHPWRLGLLLEAQSVTGSTGGAGNHLQPRMPLVRPGCFLYLWPTVCKSEGPTDSSSGFNNLIKWLTELREAFYLQHWVTKEGEKKVKAKSLSRVRLFVTPWTVASEVPPSREFSRQEYWGGLPFPSPFYLQRWVTSA